MGRTGDVVHDEIAARHNLNVHRLPRAGGVGRPGEGALAAVLEDVARAGGGGDDLGAHKRGTGNKSGETSVDEHRRAIFEKG